MIFDRVTTEKRLGRGLQLSLSRRELGYNQWPTFMIYLWQLIAGTDDIRRPTGRRTCVHHDRARDRFTTFFLYLSPCCGA